jgi:opacity protein-like surface antigen
MKGRRIGALAAIVAGATLWMPGPALAAKIVLPKPGDVGFALFGQYGGLTKAGEIGDDYGSGAGFGFRLRYRMAYDRGLGLTFERQGFDPRRKSTAADTVGTPLSTTVILTGAEIYQMFGTRTRVTKMLSAGVGLAQVTQKLKGGETLSSGTGVGDGFFVSVGGGFEYFFWQSWAVDLSMRYQALILHETTNHDVQIAAGLVFYASD